jgi:hypothetical protein
MFIAMRMSKCATTPNVNLWMPKMHKLISNDDIDVKLFILIIKVVLESIKVFNIDHTKS